MTTSLIWPPSLPQALLADGYEGALPDTNTSSDPDIGPAKIRRRCTCAIEPVEGRLILTKEQLNVFRSFYKTDLIYGQLRFLWKDPLNSTESVEMRFKPKTIPKWVGRDGDFEVTFSLEILP